jgi:hypothetical protein
LNQRLHEKSQNKALVKKQRGAQSPSKISEVGSSESEDLTLGGIEVVVFHTFMTEDTLKEFTEVFFELGVTCVVMVNTQFRITENYSTNFTQSFFGFLLQGKRLGDSYDFAVQKIQQKPQEAGTCCCYHNHLRSCSWVAKFKGFKESKCWYGTIYDELQIFEIMHDLHVPRCCTGGKLNDCPQNFNQIHNKDCVWGDEFMENHEIQEIVDDSDSEFGLDEEAPTPGASADKIVCCCQRSVPHSMERMKYQSLFGYPPERHKLIFGDLETGRVMTNNLRIDYHTHVSMTARENKIIYQIYKILLAENVRVIQLTGVDRKSDTLQITSGLRNKLIEARQHNTKD